MMHAILIQIIYLLYYPLVSILTLFRGRWLHMVGQFLKKKKMKKRKKMKKNEEKWKRKEKKEIGFPFQHHREHSSVSHCLMKEMKRKEKTKEKKEHKINSMAPSPLILYGFYTQDINSRKRYNMLLDAEERKRRDRQIPRVSIKRFKDCLFLYLYNSGNNQALLNLTGCNHENFSKLLHKFHSKYDSHTFDSVTGLIRPKKQCLFGPKGRPRELNAIGGLGLVLMWFRTRGSCARSLSYYSSDLTDDE